MQKMIICLVLHRDGGINNSSDTFLIFLFTFLDISLLAARCGREIEKGVLKKETTEKKFIARDTLRKSPIAIIYIKLNRKNSTYMVNTKGFYLKSYKDLIEQLQAFFCVFAIPRIRLINKLAIFFKHW